MLDTCGASWHNTPVMKPLLYILSALFVFTLAEPLAAATPDRFEKQGATVWVKEEMTRLKKTLALLKRVRDEKSADKASKVLLSMYGRAGTATAMGEVGAAQLPKGDAFAAAMGRNAPRIAALEEAVKEQCKRIAALELESADMADALDALSKAPQLTGADYSAPVEEPEEAEEPESGKKKK